MLGLQLLVCFLVVVGVANGKVLRTLRSGQLSNAEKPLPLEGSDSIVCAIIGFDTAASSTLKGRIFSAEEFRGRSVEFHDVHDAEKLALSELRAPVSIIFMPRLDAIAGGGRFFSQIAAYMMNIKNSHVKEANLHILVEEGAFVSQKDVEAWVRDAVREVAPPRCMMNVRIVYPPQASLHAVHLTYIFSHISIGALPSCCPGRSG
jgi:hypothetical protein